MSKLLKALGLVLLLSAVGYADDDEYVPWDQGGPPGPVEPFAPGFEVVSYAKNTGHLTLKFTITYFPDAQLQPTCDPLMMTVYPFDGLTYTGPETLLVPYRTENPYSTVWELTLPPNDTSYLVFREECDSVAYHYGITFVTTGDTLFTRWGTGGRDGELVFEWTFRHWPDPREDLERAKREWEEEQKRLKVEYPPEGTMTTGKTTPDAAMLSKLRSLSPEDSAVFVTLSERGKKRFLKMRNLERSPLTDATREVIGVDGTMYVRYRGETKFHIVEPTTDPMTHGKKFMDSLRIAQNKDYDLTVDLRNPDDYEFIDNLVDTLVPTEQTGFFRAVVKWKIIMQLRDRSIDFYKTEQQP